MYSMCTPNKYSFSPFSGFPVKDFNHFVVKMGGVGAVGGKSGESRFHTSGSRPKFINIPSYSIDFILLTSSKSKGPKITFPKKNPGNDRNEGWELKSSKSAMSKSNQTCQNLHLRYSKLFLHFSYFSEIRKNRNEH